MNDNNIQNTSEQLVPFLRNLANLVEKKQLLPEQLQSIGEFFMAYQFKSDTKQDLNPKVKFAHKDLMKFITLGWYVYCHILNDTPLPS
jgi:hypothetical protein